MICSDSRQKKQIGNSHKLSNYFCQLHYWKMQESNYKTQYSYVSQNWHQSATWTVKKKMKGESVKFWIPSLTLAKEIRKSWLASFKVRKYYQLFFQDFEQVAQFTKFLSFLNILISQRSHTKFSYRGITLVLPKVGAKGNLAMQCTSTLTSKIQAEKKICRITYLLLTLDLLLSSYCLPY